MLVGLDRLEPDRLQVVDRGAEPDRLGDRRGARLELRGQLAPASSSRRRRCGSCGRRAGTAPSRAGARCGPRGSRSRSGRSILWPETAMKSAPSAWTSRRTCGAAWAASQVRIAPRSCAQSASRAMSAIVPSEFETMFGRDDLHVLDVRDLVEQQVAVVVDRDDPERRRRCGSATYCQGTKFEWCSSWVASTTSPGLEPREPVGVGDEVQRPRSRCGRR